jgi:hypothetical protein
MQLVVLLSQCTLQEVFGAILRVWLDQIAASPGRGSQEFVSHVSRFG